MQDVERGTALNKRAFYAELAGDYRLAECLYRESAHYCQPPTEPYSGFHVQIEKAEAARAKARMAS